VSRSGLERVGLPCAWILAAAFCLSTARGDETPAGVAARDPAQWLQAIQAAAQRNNYTGTIVYQRGDDVRSSRIVHYFDGNGVRERVQTLDGRPREFIRQGDEVQCLYPKVHRVVIEKSGSRPAFPALSQAGLGHVLEHYALTQGDVERVAGIECRVLRLVPRDALRYGYRLWVDPTSGLLLKVQVLAADNSVMEQIAFSDVRIGDPISAAQLRPSWSTAGWDVVRHPSHEVELSRQGWTVTAPEGFHILTEVERSLGSDPARAALQAVYTDGLATVSVFIEPGAVQSDPEPAQRHGTLSAFMRQVGDARVTVVGEVPPTTAQSFAESVRFGAVGH
jgi:sigma-E factor negative regulatory protein RseB